MGTAIGPVLQYLMSDAAKAAVQAVNPDCVVDLCWINDPAADVLCIGRTDPYGGADSEVGVSGFIELGAQSVEEQFDIPFYIGCGRGGDAQMEATLAAVAIFDAFFGFVRSDLSLGGALQNGRWATISATRSYGTPDGDTANDGRTWVISGSLTCKNKYV